MSNYPAFTKRYHIQLDNMERLSTVEQSTKQRIENLLNDIELAEAIVLRMSSDPDTGEVTQRRKAQNFTAIAEIQERIAGLQAQIDELLLTSKAA